MCSKFLIYRRTGDQSHSELIDIAEGIVEDKEAYAHLLMHGLDIVRASQGFVAVYEGNDCIAVYEPS